METKKINKRSCPHHATITFDISIRKMNEDGSVEHTVMSNPMLSKYGITNKAQICLSAPNEADCVKLVKQKLEMLNG
tara:strand:- start:884 stop:1114 length:231 start_codon:yes stop_codon:yes gene_type:complete